ncbi:MAG TPA: hypothetical protein H9832_06020, partial [Candidatus Agathobaculum merdavium]|nr:hypothetical protein [Candidatus Agathobaculum merdavium]
NKILTLFILYVKLNAIKSGSDEPKDWLPSARTVQSVFMPLITQNHSTGGNYYANDGCNR